MAHINTAIRSFPALPTIYEGTENILNLKQITKHIATKDISMIGMPIPIEAESSFKYELFIRLNIETELIIAKFHNLCTVEISNKEIANTSSIKYDHIKILRSMLN